MSSVSAFLKKQADKDGRCKLYIRISRGNAREYIPTDIKLKYKKGDSKNNQWDDDSLTIKNHPYQVVLNNDIKRRILDIETGIITNTSKSVINKQLTFKGYTETLIKRWNKLKKESTLNQFNGEINKIERYRPGILLTQISSGFLNEYQSHMVTDLSNLHNTLAKTMKIIKTVILNAHREDLITTNPFIVFKPPRYRPGNRIFLTDEEIELLEKYLIEVAINDISIQVIGWYFLFGCYSGLRFEDMRLFNPQKHIQNGRLHLYTGKTGSPISIKIGPKLENAITKISKLPSLFTNYQANVSIKSIMINAGINKVVSFHCSRHTFAIRCAAAGISPEITGRALGHHDLKTTAIYYKIADKRMDDEMERLG